MITLKQLYQQFGNDPKWQRFALASTQPMVCVFLRKMGDRDISSLSDFDLALQLAMSEQPDDRKAKAKACMRHMLTWAAEHGHTDIPAMDDEPKQGAQEATKSPKPQPKPQKSAIKAQNIAEKPKKERKTAPKPKVLITLHPDPEPRKTKTGKEAVQLDYEGKTGKKCRGTIYHDVGAKDRKNGKRRFKDCWRAEITIDGQRFRHRSSDRLDCERWLQAIKNGDIHPTDNKADWWRMEQRKDEAVRIDEIIVNQAEEAVMLYDYHQTHDLSAISDYVVQRLLPHMVYYCAHTLGIGRQRTQTASKQAVALLLTRIIQGRPVANFTNSCKRMLRTYKQRGDFFYYETHAPRDVKHIVNGIDFAPLAELYKITKDRRI